MLYRNKIIITAIFAMAVMFISNSLTGCVTARHIDEVKAEIRDVKDDTRDTNEKLARMDSIITVGAEANNKLRNEISFSNSETQRQIEALLENYNELFQMLQEITRQLQIKHVIKSSPGSQTEPAPPINQGPQEQTTVVPEEKPAIDCSATYDDSFILVRRGEYEKAIEGFKLFLDNCEKHENASNAHYWIGECYYSLEKYVDAINEFDYLVKNFKSSVNASRALYKMARSNQELGKTKEAKDLFQKLIDEYPETLEANQAKERLKDL